MTPTLGKSGPLASRLARLQQDRERLGLSRYFLPLLKETPVEAAHPIQPVL
jgi:hypothetical protein